MTISVSSDAGGTYGSIAVNGVEKLRLNADGSATLDGNPVQRMLSLGTKATTSGTSIDFSPADGTGIPSWAKRITVNLDSVSTNGSGVICLQLGTAAGLVTTGYTSTGAGYSTGGGVVTNGFNSYFAWADGGSATNLNSGQFALTRLSGNTWIAASVGTKGLGVACSGAGRVVLPDALDRIRLTNGGGDTFDAGSISVTVEG